MGNANLGCDGRTADRGDGGIELRMLRIVKPVGIGQDRKIRALRVGLAARLGHRHTEIGIQAGEPLLLQIGLGEFRRRCAGDAEALLHQGMTDIPRILFREFGCRRENLPDFGGRRAERRLLADASEQGSYGEVDGGGTQVQLRRRKAGSGLDQDTLDCHEPALEVFVYDLISNERIVAHQPARCNP